jgi:hypothetical protein
MMTLYLNYYLMRSVFMYMHLFPVPLGKQSKDAGFSYEFVLNNLHYNIASATYIHKHTESK